MSGRLADYGSVRVPRAAIRAKRRSHAPDPERRCHAGSRSRRGPWLGVRTNEMRVAEVRARRKAAGERSLLAWALAIVPNTIAAFGVDLRDAWWWYVIASALARCGWRRSSSGSRGS